MVPIDEADTHNPRHESEVAGWELIATIASVFKPSVELFPCVFQFVHDHCFETDEIGALAVYSLRQLMMKREAEVATPSARHQVNILSSAKLVDISSKPLPVSVFGATLGELNELETFCSEVNVYRDAVSDMNDVSRKLDIGSVNGNVGGGDMRCCSGIGMSGMTTNALFESSQL